MAKFGFMTLVAFSTFALSFLFPPTSLACTAWRARNSDCLFAGSHDGVLWTRHCPNTVCHRDGHFITNIPCNNETICMPSSSMDGPTLPGTDTQLPIHTNPNNLNTICQKWYPMSGDDSQMDGCRSDQLEWRRVCQQYDPATLPTLTCSANYPGDN